MALGQNLTRDRTPKYSSDKIELKTDKFEWRGEGNLLENL